MDSAVRPVRRLLAALALAFLVGLPAPRTLALGGDDGPAWIATLRVAFDRSDAGTPLARVEARLRPASPARGTSDPVEVGMTNDGFPGGYGAHVWGFTALAEEKEKAGGDAPAAEPVAIPEGRYRVRPGKDGVLRYGYGVLLDHDASRWGPGPDEAPYAFVNGAFWTGRALFILPPGTRGEVTFETIPGEGVATSLEPVPDRKGTFAFPDEARLRETFLAAGGLGTASFTVGKTTVQLAMGDALRGWLPTIEESATRFLTASAELFGDSPPRRVLVVGNLLPGSGGFNGGVFGRDVSFLVGDPARMEDRGAWEPFVSHELFHLWNGPSMAFGDRQSWFTEGFTDYYGRLLLLRLGRTSWTDYLRDIEERVRRYLEAAGGTGLLAAGEREFDETALVYDGGSLAALCLDIAIRQSSGGKGSLDGVMKALHADAVAGKAGRPGLERIEAAVAAAAGSPMAEFFDRHVRGAEPLPVARSLGEAGILVVTEAEGLPTTNWCVWTALQCPSVTSDPEGLHVLRTESRVLAVGDVVQAVGATTVRGFDDLRIALKGKAPGDRVAIRVLRSGEASTLELTLGGRPGSVPPTTALVRATVRVAEDAGPDQRALRKALFGQ